MKELKNFGDIGNLKHLQRNELEKVPFAHDGAYSDSKELAKRTISDKILKVRAYEIARNRGYDGYRGGLASMVYEFFDKKTGPRISANEQLAEELHKPVIKNQKEEKCTRYLKTIFGQLI